MICLNNVLDKGMFYMNMIVGLWPKASNDYMSSGNSKMQQNTQW